jgi:hypothetical protein
MTSLKYTLEVRPGADCSKPGLYEGEIGGDSYIGKYKSFSRPTRHYARNVQNLLSGKSYRLSKPKAFRHIHHALAQAIKSGEPIRLIILENPPRGTIIRRERELIDDRGTLNRTKRRAKMRPT